MFRETEFACMSAKCDHVLQECLPLCTVILRVQGNANTEMNLMGCKLMQVAIAGAANEVGRGINVLSGCYSKSHMSCLASAADSSYSLLANMQACHMSRSHVQEICLLLEADGALCTSPGFLCRPTPPTALFCVHTAMVLQFP